MDIKNHSNKEYKRSASSVGDLWSDVSRHARHAANNLSSADLQSSVSLIDPLDLGESAQRQLELALIQAAIKGDLEQVQRLVDAKIDVNTQDDKQRTPLWHATSNGHLAIVRLLIDRHANLEARGLLDKTPFEQAVFCGYTEIVQLLLESGANIYDRGGRFTYHRPEAPLLQWALDRKDIVLIELLLRANVSVHPGGDEALELFACKYNRPDMVQLLIDGGVAVQYRTDYFANAAAAGHAEIMRLFIKADVDVQDPSVSAALIDIAGNGHVDILRLLSDKGLDITDAFGVGGAAFSAAFGKGYVPVVDLFIEKGMDVSGDLGEHLLKSAAENGHLQMLQLLVKHEAPVQGPSGQAALLSARKQGHTAVIDYLEGIVSSSSSSGPDESQWVGKEAELRQETLEATHAGDIPRVVACIEQLPFERWECVERECRAILKANKDLRSYNELLKLMCEARKRKGHPEAVTMVVEPISVEHPVQLSMFRNNRTEAQSGLIKAQPPAEWSTFVGIFCAKAAQQGPVGYHLNGVSAHKTQTLVVLEGSTEVTH